MQVIEFPKQNRNTSTTKYRRQQYVTAAEMARILEKAPSTIGRYLTRPNNPMPGHKIDGGGWDIPKHDALVWAGRIEQ